MHRPSKQLGFADHLVGAGRSKSDKFFAKVDEAVDWGPIEAMLSGLHNAKTGRPSHSPLVLFKTLLIQRWYDLSDPAAEDALNDRKSFARFVGLALDETAPDSTVICRFRGLLIERGLMQPLFDALMAQLDEDGLVVREGTLLDATFVQSAARPPSAPPRGQPEPEDPFEAGKRSRVDQDALWGKKGGKALFGYKLHVAADEAFRLVRRFTLTPANAADCAEGPGLVCPDGGAHYADKAYDSKDMREKLAGYGLANGVMGRPNRHHPLRPAERRRNRWLTPMRAGVEGVFGECKQRLGLRRARYTTRPKVWLEAALVLFAFNLKTAALVAR
jgi:IS5 family transposase